MFTPALHVRSYGQDRQPDAHDFAQLVLPVEGGLTLDIDGRSHRLDTGHGAFVASGLWHAQVGETINRSLIIDIDARTLPAEPAARLFDQPFHTLSPEARHLIGYMGLMAGRDGGRGMANTAQLSLWLPLLYDSLVFETPRAESRLSALIAAVEAAPGQHWDTARMARFAGLSQSRLHALFREAHDTTPRNWLKSVRIRHACDLLTQGGLPLSEVAFQAGFADQSALTRALRDATGLTPAAYRREQVQETATKKQETGAR
ncbi:MAG: AraC family transcriptional regulator [Asticcacaulis sp.]